MTEQRIKRLKRQLQESRYRLTKKNAEFSAPLREMLFVATKDVRRMSTNGACIYFDPDWLQKLSRAALDFILSHQLMHIALGHIDRPKYYSGDRFHLVCDIVVNSNLEVFGWKYGTLPNIGRIYHETFFPEYEGRLLTAEEALKCVPFDPATLKPGVRRKYMIDSEEWWDRKNDRGEQGVIVLRPGEEDPEDLLNDEDMTGGMHYYIPKERFKRKENRDAEEETAEEKEKSPTAGWDKSAANEIMSLRSSMKQEAEMGTEEGFTERVWQRIHSGAVDWRKMLDSFVQEEVCDYSFTPPDRRLQDSEFFLPDYNVLTEKPKEVLFMVDTSGSVDDEMLSAVYGEISSALMQFSGGLIGTLAFFDRRVYAPVRFSDVSDLLEIRPVGGGGTDFNCIFDHVRATESDPPVSIVVFTDGQADFPEEAAANNIPVLWLFTKNTVIPPWGKFAYAVK